VLTPVCVQDSPHYEACVQFCFDWDQARVAAAAAAASASFSCCTIQLLHPPPLRPLLPSLLHLLPPLRPLLSLRRRHRGVVRA
jgi:hypothetical protein